MKTIMEAMKRSYGVLKILLVFLLIISIAFIFLELSVKPSLLHIILNSLTVMQQKIQMNQSKFNYNEENATIINNNKEYKEENYDTFLPAALKLSNRNLRELSQNPMKKTNKTNYYYEEQMPVVVYAKTDSNDSDNASPDESDDNQYYEYDYPFNKELQMSSQQYENGDDNIHNGNNTNNDYFSYYSSSNNNEDANLNDNDDSDKNNVDITSALGRSFYNSRRQWPPTTPSPNSYGLSEFYKTQLGGMNSVGVEQNNGASPHPLYPGNSYYDYTAASNNDDTTAIHSHNDDNAKILNGRNDVQLTQEMPLLSVLRFLKMLWDLYQALVSAWNAMVMPKSNMDLPTKMPTIEESDPLAKVEPRNMDNMNEELWRESRHIEDNYDENANADFEHDSQVTKKSRYIKGDPLKGYYDFVITEGSYKFWAVFQLGTAILIIYSTFAAIYYSKVNPLTSDYDYVDYFGAGRSFPTNNLDFTDDDDADDSVDKSTTTQETWYNYWLKSISNHSFKSVLDAIDKLPTEDNTWTSKIINNNTFNQFNEMQEYQTEIMKK